MKRPTISLKSLLVFIAFAAMAIAWWVDRRRLNELETQLVAESKARAALEAELMQHENIQFRESQMLRQAKVLRDIEKARRQLPARSPNDLPRRSMWHERPEPLPITDGEQPWQKRPAQATMANVAVRD